MKTKIINVILILLCGLCIWLYLFPKENIEIKYMDSNDLAVTFENDIYTGSMRSCRGFCATDFLDSLGDIFINEYRKETF